MVTVVKGDLLESGELFIGHQTNCFTMGAGLARQIREKYPMVGEAFKRFISTHKDRSEILGKVQAVKISPYETVFNMFAQEYYGRDQQYTQYDQLMFCLLKVCDYIKKSSIDGRLALPYKIGCGLAGGDWNEVYNIIQRISDDTGVDIVLYKLG